MRRRTLNRTGGFVLEDKTEFIIIRYLIKVIRD